VAPFDVKFGFGVVDVTRSLQAKLPPGDLLEPNGDIVMVTGKSGFKPQRAVLRATQRRARIAATAHFAEDYEDAYRVDVPRTAKRLKLVLRHRSAGRRTDDLNVCVWASSVKIIQYDDPASRKALLGCSRQTGATNDTLSIRLKRGTRRVYVDVYAPLRSRFADDYSLSLARS
jgi:hypothetical protein